MSESSDLQQVIFDLLVADAGVGAIVGDRIYDGVLPEALHPYISFGASDFYTDDADCIPGTVETVQLDVWFRDGGRKSTCKDAVRVVRKALHETAAEMGAGAIVEMRVGICQVMDDPDPLTAHGVVQVTALIEDGRD